MVADPAVGSEVRKRRTAGLRTTSPPQLPDRYISSEGDVWEMKREASSGIGDVTVFERTSWTRACAVLRTQ